MAPSRPRDSRSIRPMASSSVANRSDMGNSPPEGCMHRVESLSAVCGKAVRQSWREVAGATSRRSEEHTSELQSHSDLVCRLLLEKKKNREEAVTDVHERL